ncbi:RsiV family protein [uncultured Psychrobacter sp.]|uniref:RsiV family protein n=1 Tax=uncultured Psychrobacter sp. TaxID=259303 RepID=UPI0034597D6B
MPAFAPLSHINRSPMPLNAQIGSRLLCLFLGLFPLSALANTLISSDYYLEYELPKSLQDQCYENNNCPDIDVKYIKTNQDWINNIVNRRINNIVINSKPSESEPSKSDDDKTTQTALDDFAKSQFIEVPDDRPWSYQLLVTPNYMGHVTLGQRQDFELFEIDAYVFTGGAHGMSYSEYLIFDPSHKTQISLDDMLISGKKSKFAALAYDAYKTWVRTIDEDVSSYEQNWPFTLSDNVTLTDRGVDIRYQHYSISPYAYGMPVLSIPYSKLIGVIKARFMPTILK